MTEEACRVYVGNLLPKAKEVHLTSKFARFGTIHSVWIARRPPGFAFVWFATPDEAQRAVDASGDGAMEILGKTVRVQLAGAKAHPIARRGSPPPVRSVDVDQEQRTTRCRGERRQQHSRTDENARPRSSSRNHNGPWRREKRGRSRSRGRERSCRRRCEDRSTWGSTLQRRRSTSRSRRRNGSSSQSSR